MGNVCRKCAGIGVVELGEKMIECECALVRRMAASMPPYIRKADVRAEHLTLPIMRLVRKNVLVVASWQDMKAVVKAVFIMNQKMFVKVTSDREIRDVYVGSKSRAARGDDEGQVYNSLEDLMDAPNLVVVRLNELSYKNKAAPGALEEAVCYRMDRDKPTWLFSDMNKPFSLGSHAYSDSVDDVIKSNFVPMRIPMILPPPSFDQENEIVGMTGIVSRASEHESEPVSPKHAPAVETPVETGPARKPAKKQIRPSEDEDGSSGLMAKYGAGLTKKSGQRSGSFGRG